MSEAAGEGQFGLHVQCCEGRIRISGPARGEGVEASPAEQKLDASRKFCSNLRYFPCIFHRNHLQNGIPESLFSLALKEVRG